MLPSDSELLALLDRLDREPADAIESETLEFKPWTDPKSDLKVAVEYAVCFANAQGGVVLFGVDDRQLGRAKAIHGAKGYELERWRRDVFDSTRPNLTVEVFELAVPEGTGKLPGIRIPAGDANPNPCGTASGLFKRHVGKRRMAPDAAAFGRQSIRTAAVDWSGGCRLSLGERHRQGPSRQGRLRQDPRPPPDSRCGNGESIFAGPRFDLSQGVPGVAWAGRITIGEGRDFPLSEHLVYG